MNINPDVRHERVNKQSTQKATILNGDQLSGVDDNLSEKTIHFEGSVQA